MSGNGCRLKVWPGSVTPVRCLPAASLTGVGDPGYIFTVPLPFDFTSCCTRGDRSHPLAVESAAAPGFPAPSP